MKKLILTEVKVAEAPQAPYAIGLLNAMQEVYNKISEVANENGAVVIIDSMKFELTKGAYDYLRLRENIDKVKEGYNGWCYLSHLIYKIQVMYAEKDEDGKLLLNIIFEKR